MGMGDGPAVHRPPADYTSNNDWVETDVAPIRLPYTEPEPADITLLTDKVNANCSPLEFFQLSFSEEIMELITEEANHYAAQAGASEFKTSAKEIAIYWGLCMVMGIVRKRTIALYWSTSTYLQTPMFGKVMTRTRFELISRYLHFSDNENNNPDDKLSKLRRYYDVITKSFQEIAKPGEIISFDEALIRFLGQISFKTYNASETANYGLKAYKGCGVSG